MKQRVLYFAAGIVFGAVACGLALSSSDDHHGLFVTEPGQIQDTASGWTVSVNADGSQQTVTHGGTSVTPTWVAKPGWFVYLENADRAWTYNGHDTLLVHVLGPDETNTSTFGLATIPVPVPEAIVQRLGRQKLLQMEEQERASRERLGLSPGR